MALVEIDGSSIDFLAISVGNCFYFEQQGIEFGVMVDAKLLMRKD